MPRQSAMTAVMVVPPPFRDFTLPRESDSQGGNHCHHKDQDAELADPGIDSLGRSLGNRDECGVSSDLIPGSIESRPRPYVAIGGALQCFSMNASCVGNSS